MRALCALALVTAFIGASGSQEGDEIEAIEASLRSWMASIGQEAKLSARIGVKESKLPGMDQPAKVFLSAQTIDALRKNPVDVIGWKDSPGKITLDEEKGVLAAPFGHFTFPPSKSADVAATVLGILTEEVRAAAANEDVTARRLFEALIVAEVDIVELIIKELVIMLSEAIGGLAAEMNPVPEYLESEELREGSGVSIKYHDIVMENYGQTLESSKVIRTYYPETRDGVVNIVKMAAQENARVRVSGLKHSWNHWQWGVDVPWEELDDSQGEIDYYIAMVPWELSDHLSFARNAEEGWTERAAELNSVEGPLQEWTDENTGIRHASVKVGAATLNKYLVDWSVTNGWTLAAEPIMLLMSYGGTVANICHGGGIGNPPISDQVLAVEYVDANGEIQTVDSSDELRVAAGSLGLLGVVLSYTFKLDEMTYASYQPIIVDKPMEEYMPRPGNPIPDDITALLSDHYYAQWFSFPSPDYHMPNSDEEKRDGVLWQNVWKNDGSAADAETLVSQMENDLMNAYTYLGEVACTLLQAVLQTTESEEYYYWLFGAMEGSLAHIAVTNLAEPMSTRVTEANHFQRGLHTFGVKAMEFNIPIPDDGTGNPDWTIVQGAWWLVHDLVDSYEDSGDFPIDVVIEMRMVGPSNMYLAPFYGNELGTFSIEVCSSPIVPLWLWEGFKADLARKFQDFAGGWDLDRKPRPHWGKELPINVLSPDGIEQNSAEFIREVYNDQLDLFFETLESIVTSRGSSLAATQQRFSTKFWDQVFDDYTGGGSNTGGSGAASAFRGLNVAMAATALALLAAM